MTVFGVDASTTRTGIARPDGTTTSIVPRAGSKDPLRRLHEIVEAFELELRRFPEARLAVFEDYSLGSPGRISLVRLGEVGGNLRIRCFERGLEVVAIRPSSLKLEATGNGSASKDLMVDTARARGARVANNDEADAWHARDVGLRALRGEPLSDAVAALPWPAHLTT